MQKSINTPSAATPMQHQEKLEQAIKVLGALFSEFDALDQMEAELEAVCTARSRPRSTGK